MKKQHKHIYQDNFGNTIYYMETEDGSYYGQSSEGFDFERNTETEAIDQIIAWCYNKEVA